MFQKSVQLLAVLALLVQAIVGPAAHARGVALCVSFGSCGGERSIEATGSCDAVTSCCRGCAAASTVRSDVDRAVSIATTTLIPAIALRPPCGGGCSDCVDLQIDGDPTVTSPRPASIPSAVRAPIELVSMSALSTAPAGFAWLARDPRSGSNTNPPRSPAFAPMLRAVRLLL